MTRNWLLIAVAAVFLVIALFLGGAVTTTSSFIPLAAVSGILVAFITFRKPENGLLIIVFAMLLSPQITLVELPKRSVTIRLEDVLIVVLFLSWLAYTATDKDWKGFVKTPLDMPLLALFAVYVVSSAQGIIAGRLNPVRVVFYVLKYFEYFILYWTTVNIISARKEIARYLTAGLITALIVVIYAYSLIGKVARVYAPFDSYEAGRVGETASLGGYMLIIMALLLSFFVVSRKGRWWALLAVGFMIPPFVRTLSRASLYSFLPMGAAVFLFAPRKKVLIGTMMAAAFFLFPVVAPNLYNAMSQRMNETFTSASSRHYSIGTLNFTLEESAAQRFENWKLCFTQWLPAHPFIGHGITGVGLVDSQYPLYLGEIGLIGFIIFCYVILKIYSIAFKVLRSSSRDTDQALALGLIASLTALLAQSTGVNTFVIVRIMEPFWFLTALVVITLEFTLQERAAQQNAPQAA